MHYYACPYCAANAQAHLLPQTELAVACDCKEGFFDKYKECKLQEYKCKECLICNECDSLFKPDEQFLKEQKRKIKDG